MASSILLARQPIFDLSLNTVAYELLYRDAQGIGPTYPFDGSKATAEVLLHAYSSMLRDGRIKTLPAFINFTADWLYSGSLPSLKPNELVLEVLEDISITDEIIVHLKRFTEAGYRIALDDFMYDKSWEPALELAKIVKIDIQQLSPTQLIHHVEELKNHDVTLLAEKVETPNEFEYCKKLGFTLFQGYFFCKPQLVKGRKLAANATTIMQLLAELENPEASPESLETIICKDPDLVIRLLKIVNSARFAISREIHSISEAIIALGLKELKKWALLITVNQNKQQLPELTQEILTRARMCELLAEEYGICEKNSAFMLGMLSGIDAMLNLDMDEILIQLPLPPTLKDALSEHEGELGTLLADVINFMSANWQQVAKQDAAQQQQLALEQSLVWAMDTMRELNSL